MILDGAEPTKYCPDCRLDRPASEFTKDTRRKDGLAFYCRPCRILRDEASRRRRLGPRTKNMRPRDVVVPAGQKWCPDCGGVKPLDEFPKNRRARSGYMTYCKPCHNIRTRASLEANGGARNYHLRRRYGITLEHYEQMFAEQDGLCAICREAPAEHVDHDHETNRVRGLLCFNCNGALGQFRDRTDLMLRAVAYVRDERFPEHAQYLLNVVIGGPFPDPRPPGEPSAA